MEKSKELIINKPYIDGNRLYSKIQYENKEYDLYYEVEKKYSKYLCDEIADSFLVTLLPFIIKYNYNVKIDGFISSKLYYQITNYLIPLLCAEFKKKPIKIDCKITNITFNPAGVGASISCGVDSFYTLLKHKKQFADEYNITHLTFFNAGSHGNFGGDKARKLFNDRLKTIKEFCKEYNYNLVSVDSNMNELMMMNHKKTHSFRTLGCVLALQKLFRIYYFASGYHYNEMKIDENSCGHYDTLTVQCLSNQNLTIYSSGMEVSRIEKVKYISNYKETYKWLNVCITSDKNCGKCSKCIRTMTELDSIGKLKCYGEAFDITSFQNRRTKILADIIAGQRDKSSVDSMYYKEIILSYKNNNYSIPLTSYLLSYMPTIKNLKILIKNIIPQKILNSLHKNNNNGWRN